MTQFPQHAGVAALLQTEYVTPATRQVLEKRMQQTVATPLFFDPAQFEMLSLICDLLVAQDAQVRVVNIASNIDERLKNNSGNGWRYNNMPPDAEAYKNALEGIDEASRALFNKSFLKLAASQQAVVLQALQNGTAAGAVWKEMPAKVLFEELLAEATEIFYSQPSVLNEINYAGMADAKGWQHIGLNEKDSIEPDVVAMGK